MKTIKQITKTIKTIEQIAPQVRLLNELVEKLNANLFFEDMPTTAILAEIMIVLNQTYEIVGEQRETLINNQ
jgi:hypothetical protein